MIVDPVELVDDYIKLLIPKWTKHATENEKLLVGGNLRAFASWLNSEEAQTLAFDRHQNTWVCDVHRVRGCPECDERDCSFSGEV